MYGKIRRTIEKFNLLQSGDSVVVALSGGPDSVTLLAVLNRLAVLWKLKIIAAHFNHGLRGQESDQDEEFCRRLAEGMGVIFISGKMGNIKKNQGVSPEDFYRQKRYAFLNDVAQQFAAQKIALGHTLNDQAETVLLHFLRGAGLDGLKGMLPIRDEKFIRPLIETSRKDIKSFLKKNRLPLRRDSSNTDRRYLRNRIRIQLIPYLQKRFNPNIEKNLARMAQILRNDNDCIDRYVADALHSCHIQKKKTRVLMNIPYLNNLPAAIRLRLFKKILEDWSGTGQGFSFIHIQSLDHLAQKSESGKSVCLPFGIRARRKYDEIIVEKDKARVGKEFAYRLKIPGSVYVRERGVWVRLKKVTKEKVDFSKNRCVYLDGDHIQEPLVIRNRRKGDWFEPLGSSGRKKIKKLFIDCKLPREKRDTVLLLTDQISVLWIENIHFSERVKVGARSRNILELEIFKGKAA